MTILFDVADALLDEHAAEEHREYNLQSADRVQEYASNAMGVELTETMAMRVLNACRAWVNRDGIGQSYDELVRKPLLTGNVDDLRQQLLDTIGWAVEYQTSHDDAGAEYPRLYLEEGGFFVGYRFEDFQQWAIDHGFDAAAVHALTPQVLNRWIEWSAGDFMVAGTVYGPPPGDVHVLAAWPVVQVETQLDYDAIVYDGYSSELKDSLEYLANAEHGEFDPDIDVGQHCVTLTVTSDACWYLVVDAQGLRSGAEVLELGEVWNVSGGA